MNKKTTHTRTQYLSFALGKEMAKGMGLGFSSGAARIAQAAAKVELPNRSDTAALRADWEKIGGDFRGAITQYQAKNGK